MNTLENFQESEMWRIRDTIINIVTEQITPRWNPWSALDLEKWDKQVGELLDILWVDEKKKEVYTLASKFKNSDAVSLLSAPEGVANNSSFVIVVWKTRMTLYTLLEELNKAKKARFLTE